MEPYNSMLEDIVERIAAKVAAKIASPQPAPRLMSVKEAAMYLGRSEKAVRCLISNGSLPYVHADSRIQFDRLDLETWITMHKEAR